MDIELYTILAMIILIATLVTIVFAVYSYVAFRYRQKAAPAVPLMEAEAATGPRFFKRYQPGN